MNRLVFACVLAIHLKNSHGIHEPDWQPLLRPEGFPEHVGSIPSAPSFSSIVAQSYLPNSLHAPGQCELYKVGFQQDLYFQYIQYKADLPPLKEFTLCHWAKFTNHSNDHPLFSYADKMTVLLRHLLLLILIQTLIQELLCAPHQNPGNNQNLLQDNCTECLLKNIKQQQLIEDKRINKKQSKKDVFVSRGWGAGGMPFSVLYMNPSYSSRAPVTSDTSYKTMALSSPRKQQKSIPQVRNSMHTRPKNINKIAHSVIPQLFVSYGWGPLGKK